MAIEVRSPHSGEMVKLMPKDVGKAVKDADGRVFYVLQDDDGNYYASMTRTATGSAKAAAESTRTDARMSAAQQSAQYLNAARPKKKMSRGYIAYLVVAALLVAAAWAFVYGPFRGMIGLDG